jgi:multisubunit Na+/H+ antiporter MnhE subunit
MSFLVTAGVAYLTYLLLTIGSGHLLLWSSHQLVIGAVFAAVVGLLLKGPFCRKEPAHA